MKILDKSSFEEIQTWVHRNARPIELSVWNYVHEGGAAEAVFQALSDYQNPDGGFGNGIEPDCWNPESSPYATLKAVSLLRDLQLMETAGAGHPLIKGIFRYLESGAHCGQDGWLFCIPSNDNYPRAPWWTFSEDTNRVQSMGITAALCGFILRYGSDWKELYEKSLGFARSILNRLADTDDFGEMGVGGVAVLVQDIEQSGLSASFPCSGMMERLAGVVNLTMERNPENWQYYTPRPSGFIGSPESPFYKGNEEIVDTQLDYLIDTRRSGGVWNITWSWFDLGEMYAKEFAISENWWMSTIAMENLRFLKQFGRV